MILKIVDILWLILSLVMYLLLYIIANFKGPFICSQIIELNFIENIIIDNFYSAIILLVVIAMIAYKIIIWVIFKKSGTERIAVTSITPAEARFVPVYISYFVIALSINSFEVFVMVTIILFIFTYYTKMYFFNPIFLIFGYRYYDISDMHGTTLLFITKSKDLKNVKQLDNIVRLNNFVYFNEGEKYE